MWNPSEARYETMAYRRCGKSGVASSATGGAKPLFPRALGFKRPMPRKETTQWVVSFLGAEGGI